MSSAAVVIGTLRVKVGSFSNIKADLSQWEGLFRTDIRFVTVYRRIYYPRFLPYPIRPHVTFVSALEYFLTPSAILWKKLYMLCFRAFHYHPWALVKGYILVNSLSLIINDLQDIILATGKCRGVNSTSTRDKNSWFAKCVDLDEVAHHEPPPLDLHCCPLVFVPLAWI